jgi:membrane protease YdiL (CAAX protease family)
MESAALFAGIFLVPMLLVAVGLRLTGREVRWVPLLWACFAYAVYITLLKSRAVLPVPGLLADLPLIWFGKTLSISGTVLMIWLLPSIGFRAAGFTWTQREGSVQPAVIAAVITLVSAVGTAAVLTHTPDVRFENILFQATLPGLDEELFMRGLLLLLLHQAFGGGLRIFGADTGWGFWVVVVLFGLLHGVTMSDGALSISIGAIVSTGFMGFVLTWIRERTGSLVIPILFHNAFNVAMTFV